MKPLEIKNKETAVMKPGIPCSDNPIAGGALENSIFRI